MATVTAGTKIPCRVCRTLDVGDFSILHQLTWFNMAIHSNSEYAKGTWFKERSLAGPLIFAVADGLLHHADTIAELLAQDGYEIHAYLGVDNMKITAPVLFGDTLRADAEVVDLRATKNPERLLFIYKNNAYNQRQQQVIEYQTTMMVTRKS
ncbi:MAG: hypothetical protein IPL51_14810 [Candidatus Competibacteraceae bacterium]|nr:hypothetical protein [Candidatus Competibacteraceae bacterium]